MSSEIRDRAEHWRLCVEDHYFEEEECILAIENIVNILDKQAADILANFKIEDVPKYARSICECAADEEPYLGQADSDTRQVLFEMIEDETEYSYDQIMDSCLRPVREDKEFEKRNPDLVNSLKNSENLLEFLNKDPNVVTPIDENHDTFQWVDRKLTEVVNHIKEQPGIHSGMDEFYLIIEDGKTYASDKPKGFNCFKINSKSEGKHNLLTNFKLKGIHDHFPESTIMACVLTYINIQD